MSVPVPEAPRAFRWESRPLPTGGFLHIALLPCEYRPPEQYLDPLLDIRRRESGDHGLPLVDCWPADDGDGWLLVATVHGHHPEPTLEQRAAIEGTLAEVEAAARLS